MAAQKRSASRFGTCRCRWSRARRFSIKVGAKSRPAVRWPAAGSRSATRRARVVASGTLGDDAAGRHRGAVLDRARSAGAARRGRWRNTPCGCAGGAATPCVALQRRRGREARVHADRHDHRAETKAGARRRRDPARPVPRPHRQDRPRRAARLQGRVSASALAQRRTSRQPQPIRIDGDVTPRADDGARARGASGRALGAVERLFD